MQTIKGYVFTKPHRDKPVIVYSDFDNRQTVVGEINILNAQETAEFFDEEARESDFEAEELAEESNQE